MGGVHAFPNAAEGKNVKIKSCNVGLDNCCSYYGSKMLCTKCREDNNDAINAKCWKHYTLACQHYVPRRFLNNVQDVIERYEVLKKTNAAARSEPAVDAPAEVPAAVS